MDVLAEFTEGLFLAGLEAHQHDWTGFDEALRRGQELISESESAYQEQLRRWEADEPKRQAAQLAYERAMRLRPAAAPVRVAACMEWTRPRRLGTG